MDTRPPAVMEQLVRLLVPPTNREPVVGDLRERYISPGQYLRDAIGALPFIITSRIRRTCNAGLLGFLALLFWLAIFYGSAHKTWLVASVPTFLMIGTLVLRDVYRTLTPTWPRQAAIDVALAAAAVLLFELWAALAAPQLLLSHFALLDGFPLGCVLLFFLRLQSPSGVLWPPGNARALSMAQLLTEVRGVEAVIRRAIGIEIGATIVVAVFFGTFFWKVPHTVEKLGCVLSVVGALFVAWYLHQHAHVRAMPDGLGFTEAVAFYRGALARRCTLARTYLYWYVLPLAAGPALLMGAVLLSEPAFHHLDPIRTIETGVAVIALLGAILVQTQRHGVTKCQRRIAQLGLLTERGVP